VPSDARKDDKNNISNINKWIKHIRKLMAAEKQADVRKLI
jgi:hypothetical protein